MGVGERPIPKIPTPNDRFLLAAQELDRAALERWLGEGAEVGAQDAVGSTATVLAVREGADTELLVFLLDRGAPLDVPDAAGRTPLSWAAGGGLAELVTVLLRRGADVATVDTLGRTVLHYAVFSGESAVLPSLLGAGAEVDHQDSLGGTPLMYACGKNDAQMVQALSEHGADPNIEDKLGRTAADRAHGEDNPCVGQLADPVPNAKD